MATPQHYLTPEDWMKLTAGLIQENLQLKQSLSNCQHQCDRCQHRAIQSQVLASRRHYRAIQSQRRTIELQCQMEEAHAIIADKDCEIMDLKDQMSELKYMATFDPKTGDMVSLADQIEWDAPDLEEYE